MSTTTDQERQEFEELCKNNPNYPKDYDLHKMYQSHIKKWKPLIEMNDSSIFSDWENYDPKTHLFRISWFKDDILQLEHLLGNYRLINPNSWTDSRISIVGLTPQWNQWLPKNERVVSDPHTFSDNMKDNVLRRELMRYLFECYVYSVEIKSSHLMTIPGLRKSDFINLFERIANTGNNPFDVLYYIKGVVYDLEMRKEVKRVLIGFSLFFLMYLYHVVNKFIKVM